MHLQIKRSRDEVVVLVGDRQLSAQSGRGPSVLSRAARAALRQLKMEAVGIIKERKMKMYFLTKPFFLLLFA